MRIIAGQYKGHNILTAKGESTRPTSEKARESLMAVLGSAGVPLERVADLFAGSGAVGLEALSRGASRVWFCESAAPALAALRANMAHLKIQPEQAVISRDALSPPRAPEAPFDLIFMDPPYFSGLGRKALMAWDKPELIGQDTVIVIETDAKEDFSCAVGFICYDTRTYGRTRFHFLRRNEA
ncbi:DNA methyltransferase [Alphaproteobacteria bacterium]|nr:DNA methyltransferase [Alphaproteobacteria bacterium]